MELMLLFDSEMEQKFIELTEILEINYTEIPKN